jgi:predicted transcriptional regulator
VGTYESTSNEPKEDTKWKTDNVSYAVREVQQLEEIADEAEKKRGKVDPVAPSRVVD